VPEVPTSRVAGVDLRTAALEALAAIDVPQDEHRFENIYATLYWLYRRAPETRSSSGTVLARVSARLRRTDAVLYWLQQAAMREGLDPDDLAEDGFAEVRRDPRWKIFLSYLTTIGEAWRNSGYRRQPVIVPHGYQVGTPVTALICLHGYGSRPEDFIDGERLQAFADGTGIAVISMSATQPRGQDSFTWSETFETDWAHVQAGLALVKDRVTVARAGNLVAGFSQGAQLGMELAASHPAFFAGAIAMSPGYLGGSRLDVAIAGSKKAAAHQSYFVVWYDHEHPKTIDLAQRDIASLRAAGARVVSHSYPGRTHTFAPSIDDNFAIWSQILLEHR
jgi:predicted esterase